MSLLMGPVAFIDDEIDDEAKPAFQLRKELEAHGRPVVVYKNVPPIAHIEHWKSLSFMVLDWDLSPGSFGGQGGSTLSEYARIALFDFLAKVMADVFCPIFIISAEDVGDIEHQLVNSGRFGSPNLDTRIKVLGKSAVVSDLLTHLDSWIKSNVALSVLRTWESEYDEAKNRLFLDFNALAPDWPAYIWSAADADRVEPSFELASTITANLLHRIDLVNFDTETLSSHPTATSSESARKVFNGRTVIPSQRLYDTVVMPGDLFSGVLEGEEDVIWLNLTPACHTVLGRQDDQSKMRLHVVPGQPQAAPTSKTQFNTWIKDSTGPNKALIHTLLGETAYLFDFREARVVDWAELENQRVGRLLAPFITRVQQSYSMYLQVEGTPRVTYDLYS